MSQANWWEAAPVESSADDWWAAAPLAELGAAEAKLAEQARPAVPNAAAAPTVAPLPFGEAMLERAKAGLVDVVGGGARFLADSLGAPFAAIAGSGELGQAIAGGGVAGTQPVGVFADELGDLSAAQREAGLVGAVRPESLDAALADPEGATRYFAGIGAESFPAIAGAMLTRRAPAAIGSTMATTGATTYGQQRTEGADPGQAFQQSAAAAIAEGGLSQAPFEAALGGAPLGRRLLTVPALEAGTEALTGGAQSALGDVIAGRDINRDAFRQNVIDSAIVGGPLGAVEALGGRGPQPNTAPLTAAKADFDATAQAAVAAGIDARTHAGNVAAKHGVTPDAILQTPDADLDALLTRNVPADPELDALLQSELGIDPNQPPPALQPKGAQTTASPVQSPAEQSAPVPAGGDFLQATQQYQGTPMESRVQPQATVTTNIQTEATNGRVPAPPSMDARRGPGERVAGPDTDRVPLLERTDTGADAAGAVARPVDLPQAQGAVTPTEAVDGTATGALGLAPVGAIQGVRGPVADGGDARRLDRTDGGPAGEAGLNLPQEAPDQGDAPPFSRKPSVPAGITPQDAHEVAVRIVGRDVADKAMRPVGTFDDLPQPIRDAAQRQGAKPGEVRAVHWKGHTYLVADQLTDAKDVSKAIFHEYYVHHGLRAKYRNRVEGEMLRLSERMGGVDGIQRLAEKQGIDLRGYAKGLAGDSTMTPQGRVAILTEELLAHTAEASGTLRAYLEEAVGVLRQWLRKSGFVELADLGVTDLRAIIREARQAAKGDAAGDGGPMFSRKSPQAPAGDGGRGAGGNAEPKIDLRDADRTPLDNEPIVQREVRKLKEAVQSVRDAIAGKVKNPETLRRRINDLRAAAFDSIVSRARALERRNPQSKALRELFNTFTAATGDSRVVGETVNDAIAARFAVFTNRARNILGNNGLERMTPAQNAQLREAMLFPSKTMPANVRKAATALRKLLDTQREDLIAAGVDVGEVGDVGYLPRVYNDAAILNDEAGFLKAAATQYAKHEFPRLVGPSGRSILYNDRAALANFLAAARRAGQGDPRVAGVLAEIKAKIKAYRGNSELQLVREIEAAVDSIYDDVAKNYGEVNAAAWLHRIKTPDVREQFSGVAPSGAPLTKERTLSGSADTVMADFLTTDMLDLLDHYARTSSRKIEHATMYGPKGERIQDLIDQASREGVPKGDLEQAASLLESVTGQPASSGDSNLKAAADWLHAWSYIALLAKAPISSLVEATTIALRTGDLRHTAAPLVQLYRALGGDKAKRDALNELALTIGVNGHKAVEETLMNRLGGDHAMTVKPARLLTAFFRATWLTQLTRAQRAYAVGAATGFLRKQAARAVSGDAEAAALLNEVGIADHAAFNDWIKAQGALPNPRTLFDVDGRATPRGQDYMVAVRRIVDQSIQNPGKEHRPAWTNTEGGRLFTGIMSFNYASYENIIRREMNLAARHLKEGGAVEVGKRLTMAVPAAGALILAQTITSTLREILFNADRLEDKDDDELAKELTLLGLSRTFGLGSASPLIQWWTGLKYQRSMAETMIGAGPGLAAMTVDTLAEPFTDRNSDKTDSAEFKAGQAIYRAAVAPALNVILSRIPGGGAAIMALSDKEAVNEFASMFGDKPEPRTELDKKYQEAVRELDDVQSVVKDRMALLPRSQWKEELDALKEEYPGILAGVTLDTYANSPQNRKKGRAGVPKQDKEGRPQLKMAASEEGSVLGELEGYPYWYTAGGRPKQKEGEGIQDRISTLNKAIKNVRERENMTVSELATFGDEAPGENSPPSVQALYDAIEAGTIKPTKTASDKQRESVLDELMELRRAEKRAALAVIEKGKRGEPIPKTGSKR